MWDERVVRIIVSKRRTDLVDHEVRPVHFAAHRVGPILGQSTATEINGWLSKKWWSRRLQMVCIYRIFIYEWWYTLLLHRLLRVERLYSMQLVCTHFFGRMHRWFGIGKVFPILPYKFMYWNIEIDEWAATEQRFCSTMVCIVLRVSSLAAKMSQQLSKDRWP